MHLILFKIIIFNIVSILEKSILKIISNSKENLYPLFG